jgi:2-keto-4-pentenoate hydratase
VNSPEMMLTTGMKPHLLGYWRSMDLPDPVAHALRAQMDARRRALSAGVSRVGWKVARDMPGVAEHLGSDGIVFGYLVSASVLESGQRYRTHVVPTLCAETELALTFGHDVDPMADLATCRDAIAGVAVALEIVDVAQPPGGDMHDIIVENVFHRVVAFGQTCPLAALPTWATANMTINGSVRQVGQLHGDAAQSVLVMARLLAAVGQRLRAGDRLITGSITHVPIRNGDAATAAIDGLGTADISVGAETPSN